MSRPLIKRNCSITVYKWLLTNSDFSQKVFFLPFKVGECLLDKLVPVMLNIITAIKCSFLSLSFLTLSKKKKKKILFLEDSLMAGNSLTITKCWHWTSFINVKLMSSFRKFHPINDCKILLNLFLPYYLKMCFCTLSLPRTHTHKCMYKDTGRSGFNRIYYAHSLLSKQHGSAEWQSLLFVIAPEKQESVYPTMRLLRFSVFMLSSAWV